AVAHGRDGLVRRRVFEQRRTGFGDIGGLDGGRLRGDDAFNVGVGGEPDIERGRRRDVFLREVDDLVALIGDRHAGDDHVVVARDEVGNDRIPLVSHPFAGQFGALAELVAHLALEAVVLALVVYEVVGRIG